MSNNPLLILADNYPLACYYAREHNLGPEGKTWRYISGPRYLYGRDKGRYVVITLPDARLSARAIRERIEMCEYLRMRGFERVN